MPSEQSLEHATRVPVGMAAFLIPNQLPQDASIQANGSFSGVDQDGSVFSCYKIHSSRAAYPLHILDMQFKPMQSAVSRFSAKAQSTQAKESEQSQSHSYAVQWQAVSTAPSIQAGKTALMPRAGVLTEHSNKTSLLIKRSKSSAASHALQYLQGLPGKAVATLKTRSAQGGRSIGPCSFSAELPAVAAAGLMRVAAQEYPSSDFRHLDLAAAAALSPLDSHLSGVEGILSRGQHLQPLLTRISAPRKLQQSAISHSCGVIISGGMGDVGAAIACWASTENTAGKIWLLGRTGRGRLHTALQLASCCITATACDVANAADLADSQQWLSNEVCTVFLRAPGSVVSLVCIQLFMIQANMPLLHPFDTLKQEMQVYGLFAILSLAHFIQ